MARIIWRKAVRDGVPKKIDTIKIYLVNVTSERRSGEIWVISPGDCPSRQESSKGPVGVKDRMNRG
jgi:hypothetical protein